MSPDLISGVLSFVFTVLVLSYLVGDNPLFRVAIHIFIGVTAGYVALIAWTQVLVPRLFTPLIAGSGPERTLLVFPLVLLALLLSKLSPRLARLGNPALGFLAGAGAAVAVAGAVHGTLFPQVMASIDMFDLQGYTSAGLIAERLLEGGIVVVGSLSTLAYFHFGVRTGGQRSRLLGLLAWLGQVFIAITFGVLFAGAYAAAVTALIERLHSLIAFIFSL